MLTTTATRDQNAPPVRNMYRKRPSLSCPDLSCDDLKLLRNQHAQHMEPEVEESARDARVRQFHQRSFTVPDQVPSDECRSPKGNKMKKFFHGILRQSSIGSQLKAFSTKSSPSGSPTRDATLQRTFSAGSPIGDRKHTINTLLATAFSGLADLSSDDDDHGKGGSNKWRRLHIINADGESPGSPQSTAHGAGLQNGHAANESQSPPPTDQGKQPPWPQRRSSRKKSKNDPSQGNDLYLLNDRCVACLDAARESGTISFSTDTTNSITNHTSIKTNNTAARKYMPSSSSSKWQNKTQLCLDAIKNGSFLAHIQLTNFPPGGDIVARLDGYHVEFFWFDHLDDNNPTGHSGRKQKAAPVPQHTEKQMYGGTVQLPLYIDVGQIKFVMESNESINLSAKIKGMIDRRKQRPLLSSLGSFSNHV